MFSRPFILIAVVALCVGSCVDNDDAAGSSDAATSHDAAEAGVCPATPATAMPEGECTGSISGCSVLVGHPCPTAASGLNYTYYTCACTGGAWQCTRDGLSGGICVPGDAESE